MQSQVRFNKVPEKVPEEVCEALAQSQVRFNRVPEKVPEGGFGAEPGQVQPRSGESSGEGSGEGLGGFGAKPCQVQQGSEEGSGGHPKKVPEKVPEKVAEKVPEKLFFFFCFYAFAHCIHVKIKRCGCWGYHRSLFVCRLLAGAMDVSVCIILGSFQICHCKSSF